MVNTFPFGRVLFRIDRYFDRFELIQLVCFKLQNLLQIHLLIFHHNYYYIPALKKRGEFILDSTAAHQCLATPMCVLPSLLSAFAN